MRRLPGERPRSLRVSTRPRARNLLGYGLAACALVGCRGEPPDAPAPRRLPDKAALFGDPSLVPTRTGERVRLDLADAAAIEAALDTLPTLQSTTVDVQRADDAAGKAMRVLITGELTHGADEAETRAQVEAVVRTVLGEPPDPATILLVPPPPPVEKPPPQLDVLLALAILGLGVSLGVTGERVATLRRVQAARGRRRPR